MTGGTLLVGAATSDSGVLVGGVEPPKPIQVLPITVPGGARKRRRGRGVNRRLESIQDVELKPGYGTHFSYMYIGTPPQRVSVIIDTGSKLTAFPCTECTDCGSKHTEDKYFDDTRSTSIVIASCHKVGEACQSGFLCNEDGRCLFKQRYQEGSDWKAFQVMDKVFMGEESVDSTSKPLDAIDFTFGCIYSETFLFKQQLADGIMGMDAESGTFMDALVKSGAIKQHVFSICLHTDGGTMVLGGGKPLLWHKPNSMAYARLSPSNFFTIEVIGISLGSQKIGVTKFNTGIKSFKAIVDTGTTDTFLPKHFLSEFQKLWKAEVYLDYDTSHTLILSDEKVATLPSITITIKGENGDDINIEMAPDSYLGKVQGGYSMGIFFSDTYQSSILGANFLLNYDVFFDVQNSRIGFAAANCRFRELQEEKQKQQCALKHEMVPVDTCNATCREVNLNFTKYAVGYRNWTDQYIDGGGHNCPPIEQERNFCVIECPNGASFDDCDPPIWLPCDIDCKQTMVSELEGFGCTVIQERSCSTASSCPEAHDGVMLSFVARFNSTKGPCENWNQTPVNIPTLKDIVSSSLEVDSGDVELHDFVSDGDIHNCKLPFDLHVYQKDLADDMHEHELRYFDNDSLNALALHIGILLCENVKVSSVEGYEKNASSEVLKDHMNHTELWYILGLVLIVALLILVICNLDRISCGSGGTYAPMASGSGAEDWEPYSSPTSSRSGTGDSALGVELQESSSSLSNHL